MDEAIVKNNFFLNCAMSSIMNIGQKWVCDIMCKLMHWCLNSNIRKWSIFLQQIKDPNVNFAFHIKNLNSMAITMLIEIWT